MRIIKRSLFFSSFVLSLFMASHSLAANFQGLSFMAGYPDGNATTINVFKPFLEQVEKDFKGEISFNYFSSATLYPESEAYAVLIDGRVDFGMVRPAYFPGVMNLLTVLDVPGLAPNAIVGSLAFMDLIHEFEEVRAEYPKGSEPFAAWASASYQLHSLKPITSVEDIVGKKIIVWDAIAFAVASQLGANPIRITPVDTYLSLSKGMADGVFCPTAALRGFKISDIAKHHLLVNTGVGSFTFAIFGSLWDDFTPAMKEYFMEQAPKLSLNVAKSLENTVKTDSQWMLGLDHQFYHLSEADQELLSSKLANFQDEWVQRMVATGHPKAQEIMDYMTDRIKVYQLEYDKGMYGDYSF